MTYQLRTTAQLLLINGKLESGLGELVFSHYSLKPCHKSKENQENHSSTSLSWHVSKGKQEEASR